MLNIFYGFLAGLGIKLCLSLLTFTTNNFGFIYWVELLFNSINGEKIVENYFGLIVITSSLAVSIFYVKITPACLATSFQRRIPCRAGALIVSCFAFSTLASIAKQYNPPFLWASNLFYPDTIGYLMGFPINLLALTCFFVYCLYAIVLDSKRKSLNRLMHISAALTFLMLSYNEPSGFYLFWLIQSISLLIQVKKLGTMKNSII